ncbi:MAG: winged helix DNA-binding protein [Hespellia sp.]|nr:winged helix DNA-binding protein [Hespellia sp.]
MDAYQIINDVLVHLFNEIWEQEEKAIITDEFRDITNNDMHIIEAIGLGDDSTMSAVAKKVRVTAGTLTTSVNALVNKRYALRERSEEDRRVVYIRLTEKGVRAYQHHADFHAKMTNAVLKSLSEEELPVLLRMLDSLTNFFREYDA